jgi:hypothetical protein
MKDALPMPGNMVSPNNITLQDGYTWEVRGQDCPSDQD